MKRTEFNAYLAEHVDDMFGLAMHLCKDRAMAQDLVQDLFVNLSQKDIDVSRIRNPRAWLGSILYRLFIDDWRHRARSPVVLSADVSSGQDGDIIDNAHSNIPAPDEMLQMNQQQALVVSALNRLSDKHRHLLILHDMHGYTLNEIELILGVPTGTLKSRIHRARGKLQEILKKMEPFERLERIST